MTESMIKPSKATLAYQVKSNCLQLLVELCLLSALLVSAYFFAWHFIWKIIIIICLIMTMLMRTIYPVIAYHYYTYRVQNTVIEIQRDIWFRQYQAVKVERIQFIENVANPLAKYYKLKKLKIITAGHEIALPYLTETQVDDIVAFCMTILERGEDDV
ncbi:membrane protein [Staphylococcus agnetis]|uniref:PH domain-containing protein n=1 Tax=Staphylococcus agnetis TaxID=985762 RepID=UPI000DFF301D|nr:PH domain-containing protein [Staphylococcus agnetis]SUK12329.1 membrane protein [Staphylococcus agnetis]